MQFPSLIDQVAAAVLAPAQVTENPHHRAIVDVFTEIQDLDRQLADLAGTERPAGVTATERLDALTDLLVERMAAGAELSALLSATCCCAAAYEPEQAGGYEPLDDEEHDGEPDLDPDVESFDDFGFEEPEAPDDLDGYDDVDDRHEDTCEEFLTCPSRPRTIVHACLDIFDTLGAAQYISTTELVARLRTLPGEAEGRWRYADLTPIRLALLLGPYGVQARKPRTPDGSRYRAYRRDDLQAARPDCSC
ncbi:DUF3631 domain-containing protein [Streptomyces sp. GbtcB6]|uniref:DUF3631 domain-containing protein n=1 Tax=Streptomyces sp. GbtcB6 TaxID=2824751 RepID=UPI0020C6C58A|nr:DUF3631 domain-containing protein [Streptomyces sp. GbtcB6]